MGPVTVGLRSDFFLFPPEVKKNCRIPCFHNKLNQRIYCIFCRLSQNVPSNRVLFYRLPSPAAASPPHRATMARGKHHFSRRQSRDARGRFSRTTCAATPRNQGDAVAVGAPAPKIQGDAVPASAAASAPRIKDQVSRHMHVSDVLD